MHKILDKSTKEPILDGIASEGVAEEIEMKIAALPRETSPISVADNQTKIYTNNLSNQIATRSSWLNCALRNDKAVYWVSIGHYEAVAVGN